MKKAIPILPFCILLLLSACGTKSDDHSAAAPASGSEAVSSSAVTPAAPTGNSSGSASYNPELEEPHDDYPYVIAADQKQYGNAEPDIVVGDNLYMTQINDWYMNFDDYVGKIVEIEGYYLTFGDYRFVGRKGPTCPYCTGGYVDFEFQTDRDLSDWMSETSWIKVTGILREGTNYPGGGEKPQPFYYIEALSAEKQAQAGIDTVSN